MALGIGLRLLRYLLRFPLWVDEAKQAANLLDRGYLELLEPLDYGQTSPILFLWICLTIVKVLGFSEYSLRLFSLVEAVASVFLMTRISSRLVSGLPLLLTVALFSVSYYPIRFAAEIKPYATDLFVALALTAMAIEWWRRPESSRWLWLLAISGPIAVTLSNPAIFIAGGIGFGFLVAVWRSRKWANWAALALFGLLTLAAFAWAYLEVNLDQYKGSVAFGGTSEFWAAAFPPVTQPVALVGWFLRVHTGRMFGYPVGWDAGGGTLTFLFFVAGAVVLYRSGRRVPLAILLVPFGLALAAASLRRYPYGLSGRVSQWAVPAICLLAGLGAAWWVSRFSNPRTRQRLIRLGVGFLLFFGIAFGLRDIVRPYQATRDRSARDFARWFWVEKARGAELRCAGSDFGLEFAAQREAYVWGNAQYWTNQRMYSPRHHRREAADLGRVAADHPLRVVFLESAVSDPSQGFSDWLAGMQRRYRQVGFERHRPAHYKDSEPAESVHLYEFVPLH